MCHADIILQKYSEEVNTFKVFSLLSNGHTVEMYLPHVCPHVSLNINIVFRKKCRPCKSFRSARQHRTPKTHSNHLCIDSISLIDCIQPDRMMQDTL